MGSNRTTYTSIISYQYIRSPNDIAPEYFVVDKAIRSSIPLSPLASTEATKRSGGIMSGELTQSGKSMRDKTIGDT